MNVECPTGARSGTKTGKSHEISNRIYYDGAP
jgi:hypothetical protein